MEFITVAVIQKNRDIITINRYFNQLVLGPKFLPRDAILIINVRTQGQSAGKRGPLSLWARGRPYSMGKSFVSLRKKKIKIYTIPFYHDRETFKSRIHTS